MKRYIKPQSEAIAVVGQSIMQSSAGTNITIPVSPDAVDDDQPALVKRQFGYDEW